MTGRDTDDRAESAGPDPLLRMARLLRQNIPEHATPERRAALDSVLAQIEAAMTSADRQAATGQMADLMRRVAPLLADPTALTPGRPTPRGGRQAELLEFVRLLLSAHSDEMVRLNGALHPAALEAAGALFREVTTARNRLLECAQDAGVTRIEAELLRPTARTAREFAHREHLTFARPVWPATAVVPDTDAVFYAGGGSVRTLLDRVCAERGLRALAEDRHREPASARWEQLRAAQIAVFDLTGSPSPTVYYELGMALTTGHPIVIVASAGQVLPFDVDIDPVRLPADPAPDRADPTPDEVAALAAAVDNALYRMHRGAAGDSIADSVNWLRHEFERRNRHNELRVLDVFAEGAAVDPVATRRQAEAALRWLGSDPPTLLLPTWPGGYPDPLAPRCFHVTSFSMAGAAATRCLIERACGPSVRYVRGDQVLDPDIIRSIWDHISRATHVVVDLTGLNRNVLLELGIAHVLGRNVLLIAQDGPAERDFPALAKVRCHRYSLADGGDEQLWRLLETFLHPDRPPRPMPAVEHASGRPSTGLVLEGGPPSPEATDRAPSSATRKAAIAGVALAGVGALWRTGSAYLQHTRFVERVLALPRADVPARVDEYLDALSPASRTGFGLTLSLLARRAQGDPGRRAVIEELAAAVNGAGWARWADAGSADAGSADTTPPPGPAPDSRSGAGRPEGFADDLALVHSWFSLTDQARARAAVEHLATLSQQRRRRFAEHCRQMADTVASRIAEHEEAEDRVWGSAVEDRMAYRMAKLRTGQADPGWAEEDRELRAWARMLAQVVEIVGRP